MRRRKEGAFVATTATADDHTPGEPLFAIAFHGLAVELVVAARAPESDPLAIAALTQALQRTPIKAVSPQVIKRALAQCAESTDEVRVAIGAVAVDAGSDEACTILISVDGLAAYAIPTRPPVRIHATPTHAAPTDAPAQTPDASAQAPAAVGASPEASAEQSAAPAAIAAPTPEPPPTNIVTTALMRRMLTAAGVVGGLLDDVIADFGDGRPFTDIVCVAVGTEPVPGVDAALVYHFDPRPRLVPSQRDDGSVDFHALLTERFVAEGAVVATRQPPVPGVPGRSVLGARIDIPAVKDVDVRQVAGAATAVRGDDVVATSVGRPVLAATGKVDVLPVFDVPGDLDYKVGNVDFPGDVVIHGDVRAGFTIVATGSVTVQGLVEGASITAGHDLSISGAVGEHRSVFEVGGDLVAQYLHGAEVRAGGSVVVAREIMNCNVTARGRIATAARGRIVGGSMTADAEIDVGSLGSSGGTVTEVRVTSPLPSAVIRARLAAHPGVHVHVAGASRQLDDRLEAVSFWSVAASVMTLKATADEAEAHKAAEPASNAA
jgi:hypothetical protein